LYVGLISLGVYGLYNSIHKIERGYYAIIKDGITGERIIRRGDGWFFTKPFIDKVLIVHERYGNTTLEGMLEELEMIKKAREATNSYHVVLKDDSDLKKEIETISPYMARHFLNVVKPPIKFQRIDENFIAGYYDTGTGLVAINAEYAKGGTWEKNPDVYHTIAHEDTHAQGIMNETSTEIISGEVCAEVSSAIKKYEAAVFRWFEGRLFEASYLRAKEENRLAYWLEKVEKIYAEQPISPDKLENVDSKIFEDYALFPYVKIKLAMVEDNVVYDLQDFDVGKNPEGGHFKIDDLSKLLKSTEKYDTISMKNISNTLQVLPIAEYCVRKKFKAND
jgi:hypothetical protein